MDWILRHERRLAALRVGMVLLIGIFAFTASTEQHPFGSVLGLQAPSEVLPRYIVVRDSCDSAHVGTCVAMRSAPSIEAPSVLGLRNGMVLKVEETVTVDGREWYKIDHDTHVRYPERIASDWYVAADVVQAFTNKGDEELAANAVVTTHKHILVDRSEQKLYAYDGDELFMETSISTGLDLTPTPRGTFTVYKKTPSRYMQGPLPGISDQYYDLPGVPWNLYFTPEGGVIHGAYWHNNFGEQWSHGCVNLEPDTARTLYEWADLGMPVVVRD